MSQEYQLVDLQASENFAKSFAEDLLAHDASATLILFRAGMGAGKTTLTRMLAAELGVRGRITSPTFVGLSEYEQEDVYLAHLDLYQVQFSAEDILDLLLGREEFSESCFSHAGRSDTDTSVQVTGVASAKRFVFIEWSENFDEALLTNLRQRDSLRIIECEIEICEDESRLLTLV